VIRPVPEVHKEHNLIAESGSPKSLLEFNFPHSALSHLLQLQLISSIVLEREREWMRFFNFLMFSS
jgi:hypothetical protein